MNITTESKLTDLDNKHTDLDIKLTNPDNRIKNFDAIIYHGPCPDGTGGLWSACHYSPIKTRYSHHYCN